MIERRGFLTGLAAALCAPADEPPLGTKGNPVLGQKAPAGYEWWLPIKTAPTDGTLVLVYAAEREGLPAFECPCAYHPDGGWCVDELRFVTLWCPLPRESLI